MNLYQLNKISYEFYGTFVSSNQVTTHVVRRVHPPNVGLTKSDMTIMHAARAGLLCSCTPRTLHSPAMQF